MIVLGHIGHWYHAILYLVPVLIVAGGLWVAGKRLPDEGDDEFEEYDDLDGPGLDAPRGA